MVVAVGMPPSKQQQPDTHPWDLPSRSSLCSWGGRGHPRFGYEYEHRMDIGWWVIRAGTTIYYELLNTIVRLIGWCCVDVTGGWRHIQKHIHIQTKKVSTSKFKVCRGFPNAISCSGRSKLLLVRFRLRWLPTYAHRIRTVVVRIGSELLSHCNWSSQSVLVTVVGLYKWRRDVWNAMRCVPCDAMRCE